MGMMDNQTWATVSNHIADNNDRGQGPHIKTYGYETTKTNGKYRQDEWASQKTTLPNGANIGDEKGATSRTAARCYERRVESPYRNNNDLDLLWEGIDDEGQNLSGRLPLLDRRRRLATPMKLKGVAKIGG